MPRVARSLKRATLLLSVSALVAVASLTLSAAPASAAASCKTYPGSVTFTVCVEKVSSTTARARIKDISGTYVSGSLRIYKNSSHLATSCKGKYYPGDACSFTRNGGSGSYQAIWVGAGGKSYPSPSINI